ncbi:unnamed protein product, partial [Protopolystoma xenopodis]
DDVEWPDEYKNEVINKIFLNSASKCDGAAITRYESQADTFWDTFYSLHSNRFFKDRSWLASEFPEAFPKLPLRSKVKSESSYPGSNCAFRLLEVGCGVGNTAIPLSRLHKLVTSYLLLRPLDSFVYACDFSHQAIQLLKALPEYDSENLLAFTCDVTNPCSEMPFHFESVDIIFLIFVLSSISPDKHEAVLRFLSRYLRPGGIILFRDYGRYDLAQARFKEGRCLSDNFYARGDGTRVYFFELDEIHSLFSSIGFDEIENKLDRRLVVNRLKMSKMYRVWVQSKYKKPVHA